MVEVAQNQGNMCVGSIYTSRLRIQHIDISLHDNFYWSRQVCHGLENIPRMSIIPKY